MCTVTFIPKSNDGFILTSNRDESPNRTTSPPDVYTINNAKLLFPKDEIAGGTWIGASDRNRMICLLNGGFTAHERQESYRMSRGIIVTDLLTTDDVVLKIKTYDFVGIEPFTVILLDWSVSLQIYELVWDGVNSHFTEKPLAPMIWSSSLLYSEEIKKKREQWFSKFLMEHINPSEEELLQFHHTAGEGDLDTNIIMDRGFVKTKSITQYTHNNLKDLMRYEDLQTQCKSEYTL